MTGMSTTCSAERRNEQVMRLASLKNFVFHGPTDFTAPGPRLAVEICRTHTWYTGYLCMAIATPVDLLRLPIGSTRQYTFSPHSSQILVEPLTLGAAI
ncbi:hypothetical protein EXIGLDRAFT_727937 [Exidia glandulosa HHB12029]|uniref:Uncharacterized protein n=1 Tax=Exidia glandulosa HHB12029 TaxID=1314781 RepID=A0A165D558_EXIGL|nr:hypothetical protein EXIGLDRAFT_727937 [Exidia glandulosa HHB12029]